MTATRPLSFLRENIRRLAGVEHGSISAAELAPFCRSPADVLDFSVNINPLGPAPAVLRAVQDTDWTRYPGDDEAPLRTGLAQRNGVSAEQVALGNGSVELLWLIALAFLQPEDHAAVLGPTFGEYARAACCVGVQVHNIQALRELPPARVLFICNPNNPTGLFLSCEDLERVLSANPSTLVVLDEAYAAFAPDRWRSEPLLTTYANLLILRSLTKEHALPGLRLGYLLAVSELACAIESVRPPWSVNAGALRAGLAVLGSEAEEHVERARSIVARSRELLTQGFNDLGYVVSPSAANFVLVNVGGAASFRRALLPHGLVVRDCSSFGLPTHIRVACRLPDECEALLDVVLRLRNGRVLPTLGEV